MAQLKGSKTEKNLKDAFAGESQANRRYLYFAKVADVEGYPEVAMNFRETAEGETIAGETHEYTDMYPGMARTAREEGFAEVADWFETLAKAEKSHAGRFDKMLKSIS
jgi:rubrerythrin